MDLADIGVANSTLFDFGHSHYCAEGVKNDFQKVVDRFLGNDSIRYEDFVRIWKEMHFYNIFHGRQSRPKLKEFTEECLRLACELWVEAADFQIQVSGLYLLYGLYFCQPIEPKSKIRITLPMWQGVREFVTSVKQYNHLDVEYVFMKLVLSKAFYFVATVSNINEIRTEDHRRLKLLSEGRKTADTQHTSIQELTEPDTFLKLEVIDQQYQQMKCTLSGLGARQPDLSLRVIYLDLPQRIVHDVTSFKSRRLGLVSDHNPVEESGFGGDTMDANLRNEIKQKALSKMAIVRRDRRHRHQGTCKDHVTPQSHVDADDDENTVTKKSTDAKTQGRKLDQKSRCTAPECVITASSLHKKNPAQLKHGESGEKDEEVTFSDSKTLSDTVNSSMPVQRTSKCQKDCKRTIHSSSNEVFSSSSKKQVVK